MRPDQFIDFATELANSAGSGAAAHRSATSRAYYGVYHAVRFLIEKGLSISCRAEAGGNEHKLVQEFLKNCQVEEAAEVGRLLGNLHKSRRAADYDLDETSPETQADSQLSVARARNILAKLQECATGPLRQKIIAGMSQHKNVRNRGNPRTPSQ